MYLVVHVKILMVFSYFIRFVPNTTVVPSCTLGYVSHLLKISYESIVFSIQRKPTRCQYNSVVVPYRAGVSGGVYAAIPIHPCWQRAVGGEGGGRRSLPG